jgi:hypothetical protein
VSPLTASERVGCEKAVWRQNLGRADRTGRSWGGQPCAGGLKCSQMARAIFASSPSRDPPLPARASTHTASTLRAGAYRGKARTAEKSFKGSQVRIPRKALVALHDIAAMDGGVRDMQSLPRAQARAEGTGWGTMYQGKASKGVRVPRLTVR